MLLEDQARLDAILAEREGGSGAKQRGHMLRRGFLKAATTGAFLAFGTGSYSYGIEPRHLVVEHVALPLPGLAAHWHNKRIVQLTDIHASPQVSGALIQRAFGLAAECDPELIVVTGDWITDNLSHFDKLEKAIRPVARRSPIIGSTGNHDFGRGCGNPAVADELRDRLLTVGVKLLRNEAFQPKPSNVRGELTFVGIDDLWSGLFNAAAAELAPANGTTILMSHNPDTYEKLAGYRWQAMLCGHTHGGQVQLPGIGPIKVPVTHRERYAGLFSFPPFDAGDDGAALPGRHLYVSRGVGHWLHIRLFCPPEVTCFTLRGV